jgi:RNA-directed DNA polymerase
MTIINEQLLQDVFTAYYDARRNKRNTDSQVKFEMALEHNLVALYEEIRTRSYRPSPCICFITFDPVRREIFASSFRDRVVHHLLFNYIAPLFEATFIHDSYSCRREKGTLKGIERFEHHLRSCTDNYTHDAYVLKLDIKGYFMSIDKQRLHGIITQEIERKTSGRGRWHDRMDKELVVFLLDRILLRNPTADVRIVGRPEDWEGLPPSKSLFHSAPGTGLPIGDLTSQLFSNIYLNRLDQFAKRTLGCRHYGRYVDDFYVIDHSRRRLADLIPRFRDFLRDELCLTLHPHKIYLQHCSKGTQFLGAYVMPHRRYPRRRTIAKFRRQMRAIESRCEAGGLNRGQVFFIRSVINSYCGYLGHFKSFNILRGAFNRHPFYKYLYFCKGYSKACMKRSLQPSEG